MEIKTQFIYGFTGSELLTKYSSNHSIREYIFQTKIKKWNICLFTGRLMTLQFQILIIQPINNQTRHNS